MGFAEQLQEIIGRLPEDHQTVLFSATLPKLLVEFARAGEWPTCPRTPSLPQAPAIVTLLQGDRSQWEREAPGWEWG